ncbi:MAG: PASTA domain-containing protein [bacterium]|nr:PASTA domain-containing protein [bacterium]
MPRDWVFPIVFACFVGVVVWFAHEIHGFLSPPSDTVTVPSFVGQSFGDASSSAQRMHLTAVEVDHATSDRYPKGVVVTQRPEAGTKVREGRQVSFVVSDGMVSRLMPDLRYQSMREVELDLSRAHLQLGKVTSVKSDVVPEGHVIAQDPQPLANVYEGGTVNLTVSKGGIAEITLPSFVGMKVDDARTLAHKLGVKLGQLVWTPLGAHGPAHGVIARQSVAPGTKVAPYDPVSLQVSAGPNESGYLLRQVHLLVSVPVPQGIGPGQSVKVVLRMRDATGQYDIYRAYAQPGQKLDFTVAALGTSVVDFFVDDVLVGETRLGNEPAAVYDRRPKTSPSPGATP